MQLLEVSCAVRLIYGSLGVKRLRQGIKIFVLGSINLLIMFGIRRNCLRSGRSRLLYVSISRVIKEIS